jgi:hypothetical protein
MNISLVGLSIYGYKHLFNYPIGRSCAWDYGLQWDNPIVAQKTPPFVNHMEDYTEVVALQDPDMASISSTNPLSLLISSNTVPPLISRGTRFATFKYSL